MDKAKVIEWIDEKLVAAEELYDEAEASREESDYTDIDALEQSVYNDAVITVLTELKNLLQ